MPFCSISNCKNSSSKVSRSKGGVTFHHFPKDEDVKDKWVEATGKKNWLPTKNSTVCSVHFLEEDFLDCKKYRKLAPDVHPTIDIWKPVSVAVEEEEEDDSDSEDDLPLVPSTSYSIDEDSLDIDEPPTKKFKAKTKAHSLTFHKKKKKLKLKQRLKHYKIKPIKTIISPKKLLEDLKRENYITYEAEDTFERIDVSFKDLYARNLDSDPELNGGEYSPELRSFALTLNFYSPSGYNYVKRNYDTILPDPQTVRSWYKIEGGQAGFTGEAFEVIKMRVEQSQHPLYCCLTFRTAMIRHRDGQFVEYGDGDDTEYDSNEPNEALIFFITCINGGWKLPIGYFLTWNTNAEQRKNLVVAALELLHESGITTVGFTIDTSSNLSVAEELGCNFDDMKTTFPHPVTKESIAVFVDPGLIFGNIRMALLSSELKTAQGEHVKWSFIDKLQKVQEKDIHKNLKYGYMEKMKVRLASYNFSYSIADGLTYCRETLGMTDFKGSSATEQYIRIMNNLFDIMTSRSFLDANYKKPLNAHNQEKIFEFLREAEQYLQGLARVKTQSLFGPGRKTSFTGFLICIHSIRKLYQYLVEQQRINFLAMHYFTMDHLKQFVFNVCATLAQGEDGLYGEHFKKYYKKMLRHLKIKDTDDGRDAPLEHLSILDSSSPVSTINNSYKKMSLHLNTAVIGTEIEEYEKEETVEKAFSTLPRNTEYKEQLTRFMAATVVQSLLKKVRCEICVSALVSYKKRKEDRVIVIPNNKGYIIYPSEDVVKICLATDLMLRQAINHKTKFMEKTKEAKKFILSNTLECFIGSNVFESINAHQLDQGPTENHIVHLIRAVATEYIDGNYQHILFLIRRANKPTMRQWAGQFLGI